LAVRPLSNNPEYIPSVWKTSGQSRVYRLNERESSGFRLGQEPNVPLLDGLVLKVLGDEVQARERARQEVTLLAELNNDERFRDSIVSLAGFGEGPDGVFIATPFIVGGTVTQKLAKPASTPPVSSGPSHVLSATF
jgi:hypothetical protein